MLSQSKKVGGSEVRYFLLSPRGAFFFYLPSSICCSAFLPSVLCFSIFSIRKQTVKSPEGLNHQERRRYEEASKQTTEPKGGRGRKRTERERGSNIQSSSHFLLPLSFSSLFVTPVQGEKPSPERNKARKRKDYRKPLRVARQRKVSV